MTLIIFSLTLESVNNAKFFGLDLPLGITFESIVYTLPLDTNINIFWLDRK